MAAAALALGFAGCTTRPQVFHRIDGTVATPKQFAADKAICQGELDKAYLAKQRGLFAPDELRGVFAGCMAQRGYLANQCGGSSCSHTSRPTRAPLDPAVLLRIYAKRTKKADTSAAAVIGAMSKGILGRP